MSHSSWREGTEVKVIHREFLIIVLLNLGRKKDKNNQLFNMTITSYVTSSQHAKGKSDRKKMGNENILSRLQRQ